MPSGLPISAIGDRMPRRRISNKGWLLGMVPGSGPQGPKPGRESVKKAGRRCQSSPQTAAPRQFRGTSQIIISFGEVWSSVTWKISRRWCSGCLVWCLVLSGIWQRGSFTSNNSKPCFAHQTTLNRGRALYQEGTIYTTAIQRFSFRIW